MTYFNKIILSTLASIFIVFALTIILMTNILFFKNIEHVKNLDIENSVQITDLLKKDFNHTIRLLNFSQELISKLDFRSGTIGESTKNILISMLNLDPNIYCTWFILKKGILKDSLFIKEYINLNGKVAECDRLSKEEALKDPNTAPWYFEPLTTGETYFSPKFYYDYNDKSEYTAIISVPVLLNGKIIGVCGVNIPYKNIIDLIIDEFHKKYNRIVILLSQDMTILHAHDDKLINKNLADFPFKDIDNLHREMKQGGIYSNEIISPFLNEKIFLYVQPIPFSIKGKLQYLYLYIGTPVSELYSDSYSIIFLYIIATGISVLFILSILIVSGYRILQPIKSLTNYAQQITSQIKTDHLDEMTRKANFTYFPMPPLDIKQHKKSEIAILWDAFAKMLEVIQENFLIIEKRVQERTYELQKHSNYIKLLIDGTANIYVLLDYNMNIAYCSDSYLYLFGLKDYSDIIGLPLAHIEAIHPDKDYIKRSYLRLSLVANGEELLVVDDFINWSMGTRSYHITYKRMLNESGNFDGIVITFIDTTDVRLEEAERRMNDMLYSTMMPCQVWDENGLIIAYNKIASQVFGVPEDLSSEDFTEFFLSILPEYQPDGRTTKDIRNEAIHESLTKGFMNVNIRLSDSNGKILYFTVSLARIAWLSEYRLIAYYHDMTDIKIKESEAKEAEERIKLMFDATPLSCILWDEDYTVIDCNEETLKIFALPNKQVFLDDFMRFASEFQPDGRLSSTKAIEHIQMAFEKGRVVLEWLNQDFNGELIPTEVTLVRIRFRTNFVVVGYIRDLREIKTTEQKIQESLEREHYLELQKEAAQAANEAKSRFLANMSHEIRTPMNAILGMTELLLSEKLNSRQLQYAKDLKTSAMALLEIINDILDVSKIQTDRLSLIPVHYDFNMFIDNIASIVHFLIEDKKITFKLLIQEKIPLCLYGDDIRLRQILLNLLSNAIKFTQEGYVRLMVDATDTSIHFTVSDTGIGIKAEDITMIFGVFEQFDIIKNRNIKGTGLGLAITKSLVEMMGGQITVESVYGNGSSFHVEIPKIIGDETLIQYGGSSEIAIYAPDAKILVVDDNIINLNVACGLLQLYQIKTESAISGEQAVELVRQNKYDIVFMDHRMSGMDGVETTKVIRKLGINVPIIALTASVLAGAKETLLESGMDDYLAKPIIKNELNHILKKWLPREKQLSPISETIAPGESEETEKTESEDKKEFWKKIEQIEELYLATGLNRVDGQKNVYEKTLELLIDEIEKCIKNLNEFLTANDMKNFCIEVHSMKGALANIGAMDLSAKARELEIASDQEDVAFCSVNLIDFNERLDDLRLKLKEAFAEIKQNHGRIEIPPELLLIFEKLKTALNEMNFVAIDNEVTNIDKLNLSGALKEETDQIKDAVLIMDYERAINVMQKLLSAE
ncbi:MAG: ATP-binding protein [Leptospirales bacterium]|nr:ATP-binding protein [Leptospirales bacterium]